MFSPSRAVGTLKEGVVDATGETALGEVTPRLGEGARLGAAQLLLIAAVVPRAVPLLAVFPPLGKEFRAPGRGRLCMFLTNGSPPP
jgi:hypothetical protein